MIGGQVEIDRARPAAARDLERLPQQVRQRLDVVDPHRQLGDRREDALRRDVLRFAAMRVGRRDAAGQHHHRLRAAESLGDAGDEIGRARPRRDQHEQ